LTLAGFGCWAHILFPIRAIWLLVFPRIRGHYP
jgi:hypothetical protein